MNKSLVRSTIYIIALLFILLASGCQPTPTSQVVKNKSQDSFLNELLSQTVDPSGTAPLVTNYSKAWKAQLKVKPYNIDVTIDATVETPTNDKLPVYLVEPQRLTQAQVDGFLSLFDSNMQYHLDSLFGIKTRADYQRDILEQQAYLAEIPTNSEYSKVQKEEYTETTQKVIKQMQQAMVNAPDQIDDVITPVFTDKYLIALSSQPEYVVEDGSDPIDPAKLKTNAEQYYKSSHTDAINVKWQTGSSSSSLDIMRSDSLPSNSLKYALGKFPGSFNIVANSSDLEGFHTNYAKAKAIAENAVAKLGLDYMSVAHSAKGIQYSQLPHTVKLPDNSAFVDFSKLQYSESCYLFFFTRNIDGVNETYCSNNIGIAEQYDQSWPYDKLFIAVDDEGIRRIQWESCPSKLGELLSPDAKLLPFDQIQKIAEQQFVDGNIKFGRFFSDRSEPFKNLKKMEINIDKVTLGYMRVKLPGGAGKYSMVPVWDFFGSYAAIDNSDKANPNFHLYSKEWDNTASYRNSYLTINAIDGSVIDRGQGY